MNDREFTIGDKRFSLSKIDAFKQFAIVRRLGPILGEIIPVAQKLKGIDEKQSEESKFEQIAQLIQPIMAGISKLSDADANLVLLGLCSAVEMHQVASNSWARVAVGENLMVNTLTLSELLQIAGRAFAYNLSGFFPGAPQALRGVS